MAYSSWIDRARSRVMEPFGFRMILALLLSLIVAAKESIASSAVLDSSTIRLEIQRIPSRKIGTSALAHPNRTREAIVEGDRTGVVLAPSALPPPRKIIPEEIMDDAIRQKFIRPDPH